MTRSIRVCSRHSAELRKAVIEDTKRLLSCAGIHTVPYKDLLFGVLDEKKLGLFLTENQVIILSEELLNAPYEHTLSVALHECAHAREFQLTGSTAHDEEFRAICRQLGIGDGYEKAILKKQHDRSVLEKIRKLEALSASPFEAEAQAALLKARQLMAENHIQTSGEAEDELIYETDLYEGGRIYKKQISLAQMVQKITGCYPVSIHNEAFTGIRAYGSRDELEVASYLWDCLEKSIDRALSEKRAGNPWLFQGQQGTSNFYLGVLSAISEKYSAKEEEGNTTALVRISDENALKAKRLVFPETRLSARRMKYRRNDAVYNEGRSYGSHLEIRKGVKEKRRAALPGSTGKA